MWSNLPSIGIAMPLKPVSPEVVNELIKQGALMVDIRSADEYSREHIVVARNIPMERLAASAPLAVEAGVIFHCKSGNRTSASAVALSTYAGGDGYVLEGGLDAWKKAGLPIIPDASQPIEMQRQVQIAAGSLIMLGAILGASVSPWFYLMCAGVGAGLVFAGVSGFCGMARLLKHMPWNRIRQ